MTRLGGVAEVLAQIDEATGLALGLPKMAMGNCFHLSSGLNRMGFSLGRVFLTTTKSARGRSFGCCLFGMGT